MEADYSGVLFTLNPMNGLDTEIVLELTCGLGDCLMDGQVSAVRYRYDRRRELFVETAQTVRLRESVLRHLIDQAIHIQSYFGEPLDIEFAIRGNEVFILQARPITAFEVSAYEGLWTSANFKDGGVASEVCTPLMASLYHYSWDGSLRAFLIENGMSTEVELTGALSKSIYGRVYWNIGVVKKVMSKIPGYREADFNTEFGIQATEAQETSTVLKPGSLFYILKVSLRFLFYRYRQTKNQDQLYRDLRSVYEDYRSVLKRDLSKKELIQRWNALLFNAYYRNENNYFNQVFINTIEQSLYKEKFSRYLGQAGFADLLSGLEDVSHLRPAKALKDISRAIREHEEKRHYYTEHSAEEIVAFYQAGQYPWKDLDDFFEAYGYHSKRELDISYPNYQEAPLPIIQQIKNRVEGGKNSSQPSSSYEDALNRLKNKSSKRRFRRLVRKLKAMRRNMWWREEYKDLSTRYYDLIRQYSLRLAKLLHKEGKVSRIEDIWFLEMKEISSLLENNLHADKVKDTIKKNRLYYNGFRQFKIPFEIPHLNRHSTGQLKLSGELLQGIGCQSGQVSARVRVRRHMHDIHLLKVGEILVTNYMDTGWAMHFPKMAGLITAHGGLLCHAAVVARELSLPCIVDVTDACEHIPDGAEVLMDGRTGQVKILETE